MARNVGVSVENNFTRGLITEVTGVNSPENSVLETLNIQYGRTGKAVKRKGFAYEVGAVLNNVSSPGVRLEYLWQTVSDNNEKNFVVTQVGSRIYFYESTDDTSLSASRQSFSINLMTYAVPGFSSAQVQSNFCSFSSGKGYLFIAHPNCDTTYVQYNISNNTITVRRINILIRDFEGVNDGLPVDFRPATSSVAHLYNLFNQGWYASAQFAGVESVAIQNVYGTWVSLRDDEPANTDVWWYYTTVNQGGATVGVEAFNPSTVDQRAGLYGNTPAPKGHYIINPFDTQRSGASGIAGVPEQTSGGYRPSVVSFYAGRAFYAGVGRSGYSSTIYFSQIIEDDTQLAKCYQRNDPTSREVFDLLDSDGGTIKVQDINNILDLRVVGQSLVVFATNGIWSISGTDNGPFKATDYTVSKLSAFPTISKTSIVDISGTPIWWNYEGIFSLKNSELGLTNEINSLSVATIQSFYDSIPPICKLYAKGSYNDQMKMVYWLYSTDQSNPSNYDRVLVMDAVTGAFYIYTIPSSTIKIVGLVPVRTIAPNTFNDQVILNSSDTVILNNSDNVVVSVTNGYIIDDKVFKFLTDTGTQMSFAEIRSDTYLDWGSIDYEASFITGYRIRGELLRKSQVNYLTVVTEDDLLSSCFVQPVWDYANSHDSGRFGNPQQVYRPRSFRDYQRSRLKIRGTGYSLQFKFYGLPGQPFTIVGWFGFESTTGAP